MLATAVQPESGLREVPGLGPNDSPEAAADELRHEEESLMVVTHLPLVSFMASLLLTGRIDREPLVFHTGSMACLHGAGDHFALD